MVLDVDRGAERRRRWNEDQKEAYLAPRNMTAGALAQAMDLSGSEHVERIIGELKAMTADTADTADTALRLERVLGVNAQFSMNLQTQHDLSKAPIEGRTALRAAICLSPSRMQP